MKSFPNLLKWKISYCTLTNILGRNSQKLLDRNSKCINIFIEQISLYHNVILLLISFEWLLLNFASKLGLETVHIH